MKGCGIVKKDFKKFYLLILGFLLFFNLSILVIFKSYYLPSSYRIRVEYDSTDETNLYQIEQQKWSVNFNILQYSSFIFITSTNVTAKPTQATIRVESLFAYGFINNEAIITDTHLLTIHTRCVLKNRKTNSILFFNATNVVKLYGRPMTNQTTRVPWKAVCEIKWKFEVSKLDLYDIAIIDYNSYVEKSLTFSYNDEQMKQLIQFQTPNVINTTQTKRKSIAHCLHAIRNLNEKKVQKLVKWLKYQQVLGYSEMKLYFFEQDIDYIASEIYQHFNRSFIQLIRHQINYEDVCEWHLSNFGQGDFVGSYMIAYCKGIYARTFNLTNKDDTNFIHGRSQTNDCFLRFKYKYDYVTNYDFDELILPRKYQPFNPKSDLDTSYTKCDAAESMSYNIHDYAIDLFEKYASLNNDSRISSIEFDCLPYIVDDENATTTKFINKLRLIHSNFSLAVGNQTVRLNLEKSVPTRRYPIYMTYLINEYDYDYIDAFLNQYDEYLKCYRNSSDDFNNALLTAHNASFFYGKSIFNTNYTDYITFHYAVGVPDSLQIKMPIQEAYVSHLREDIEKYYQRQNMSIQLLYVDLEYYKFF